MPMWVTVLQALLTPLIALLALYVAWQQWRTNHNKFRLDYFDRRFSIYKAAMQLATEISSQGNVSNDELHSFSVNTREAEFFFDDEIAGFCRDMHNEARAIQMGCKKLQGALSEEQRKNSQELLLQRVGWFNKQVDEMPGKFRLFLKVDG